MVSPAPTKCAPSKEDTNKPEEHSADEEAAFQALLNSQREVLARMGFGNSNSEILVVDGPDNLPLVSPHNSAHWSYGNDYELEFEYDVQYNEQQQGQHMHYPEQQQQQPHYHQHHQGYYDSYHPQQQDHYYQQQQHASLPRASSPSMGLGDDSFVLDDINIAPANALKFDAPILPTPSMRRRKRETEQELVYKKKQRPSATTCSDDVLPGPSELDHLDESNASLLLEDLDFAAKEESQDQEESEKPAAEEEPAAVKKSVEPSGSMDDDSAPPLSSVTVRRRPPLPKRSSRNLWKPRRRSSADISIEERRSMWKPRSLKRNSSNASSQLHDSCASLQLEDLATTTVEDPSSVHQVSLLDGDLMDESAQTLPAVPRKRLPSRTSSTDSNTSVQSLSMALAQSRGSTQSIQEWDKKMGLKRSHSKTMRQTSKSREQLLAFFNQPDEGVPKTIVADEQVMEV